MLRAALPLAAILLLSAPSAGQTARDTTRGTVTAPRVAAQTATEKLFGFASYDSLLHSMPDYVAATTQIEELRSKYDAELKLMEDEFNTKYEEFLDGMKDFPQSILEKRQNELQDFLERNVTFKDESRRLLDNAETEALAPLHAKLTAALREVGEKHEYLFILNTDNNICPFISTDKGTDVTEEVQAILNQ